MPSFLFVAFGYAEITHLAEYVRQVMRVMQLRVNLKNEVK
ncbi:hypothetical protein FACS189467_8370 [Bacteroidia bacterium]|nr:hypothetical protein FACS189467_8370 [Bacteroidia bacterium]